MLVHQIQIPLSLSLLHPPATEQILEIYTLAQVESLIHFRMTREVFLLEQNHPQKLIILDMLLLHPQEMHC